MSQKTMELRVGILILVSMGLLAAFIVVMGGVNFEPTFSVNVDFDNPGGLKNGAPVRMAGVKIGNIEEIRFTPTKPEGASEPAAASTALIRVVTKIERQYQDSIYENSRWYVTTQSVLGELFLAVDPGTPDQPPLQDQAVVQGISPPRLDLLLSEAYEILHKTYLGITRHSEKLEETFDGLHKTLKGSGEFFDKNSEKLDTIVNNLEQASIQTNEMLAEARHRYVSNPQIDRIIDNVDHATATLDSNLVPLIEDGRRTLADVSRVAAALGSEQQVQQYRQITDDVAAITSVARRTTNDAHALVGRIQSGRGTLGAIVMDEALYDDVQELVRDLKHNPWKFFWRD